MFAYSAEEYNTITYKFSAEDANQKTYKSADCKILDTCSYF